MEKPTEAEIDAAYSRCSPMERKFVEYYVVHSNQTKAAIAAGLSPRTASSQGWRVYNREHVRGLIDMIIRAKSLTGDGVIAIVKSMAESDIKDYYTKIVKVPFTPMLDVPVLAAIAGCQRRIEILCTMFAREFLDFERRSGYIQKITYQERLIADYELQYFEDPDAIIVIAGRETLIEEKKLDMDALLADKERGKIKRVKIDKDGTLDVELYSADAAVDKLARMHGLYEKDNKIIVQKDEIDYDALTDDQLMAIHKARIKQPEPESDNDELL